MTIDPAHHVIRALVRSDHASLAIVTQAAENASQSASGEFYGAVTGSKSLGLSRQLYRSALDRLREVYGIGHESTNQGVILGPLPAGMLVFTAINNHPEREKITTPKNGNNPLELGLFVRNGENDNHQNNQVSNHLSNHRYNGANGHNVMAPPVTKKPRKPKAKQLEYEDYPGFCAWWKAYPITKGKKTALESWVRDNLETRAGELLEILQAQVKTPYWQRRINDGYCEAGAVYLNNAGYDDEPEEREATQQEGSNDDLI